MSNTIQLTNTYGIVNIGTPNGLKNSLNAEPIGIVIIIATNTITTLYHSGTKNNVNAVCICKLDCITHVVPI